MNPALLRVTLVILVLVVVLVLELFGPAFSKYRSRNLWDILGAQA